MDIVERLRKCANGFPLFKTIRGDFGICDEAADEIERLRKVNVMQVKWLHEAHENHKLFKDKVRQLLSVESVVLKD